MLLESCDVCLGMRRINRLTQRNQEQGWRKHHDVVTHCKSIGRPHWRCLGAWALPAPGARISRTRRSTRSMRSTRPRCWRWCSIDRIRRCQTSATSALLPGLAACKLASSGLYCLARRSDQRPQVVRQWGLPLAGPGGSPLSQAFLRRFGAGPGRQEPAPDSPSTCRAPSGFRARRAPGRIYSLVKVVKKASALPNGCTPAASTVTKPLADAIPVRQGVRDGPRRVVRPRCRRW